MTAKLDLEENSLFLAMQNSRVTFILLILILMALLSFICVCGLYVYKELRIIIKMKKKVQLDAARHVLSEKIHSEVAQSYGISKISFDGLKEEEFEFLETIILPHEVTISFTDIGGLKEEIGVLREALLPIYFDTIVSPALLPVSAGVILHGPDGCGRTMLVKALSAETCLAIIHLQSSDIVSQYGYSLDKINSFFNFAGKIIKKPYIIYLDNIPFIEAIEWHDDFPNEKLHLKNFFMQKLDELLKKHKHVIPIASIPEKANVDDVLLKRLPVEICVGLPDLDKRKQIFEAILKPDKSDSNLNLELAARESEDFTGADIKAACRFAALKPLKDMASNINFCICKDGSEENVQLKPRAITNNDIIEGIAQVHGKKKPRNISPLFT